MKFDQEPTERDKMIAKGVADGISNALTEMNRMLLYLMGIVMLAASPFTINGGFWAVFGFGASMIFFAWLTGKIPANMTLADLIDKFTRQKDEDAH